jgi:hypothetical protein
VRQPAGAGRPSAQLLVEKHAPALSNAGGKNGNNGLIRFPQIRPEASRNTTSASHRSGQRLRAIQSLSAQGEVALALLHKFSDRKMN